MSHVNGFEVAYCETGGQPQTVDVQIGTSQTIKIGYPLTTGATAGKYYAATSADTAIFGIAAGTITTTATLDSDDVIPCWPCAAGTVFAGKADSDLASTLKGKAVDIVSTSGDDWKIDIGTSSTKIATIVDIPEAYRGTYTSEKFVYVKFVSIYGV